MSDTNQRPLLRLFTVLIFVVVEMGIALPVLPALARALNGSALDIGMLFAVQSLGQFITAPLWGALSDRIGRKRVILITIILVALLQFVTALSTSILMLYLVRFAAGLSSGGIATASALVADVTDEASRSKGMAVVGISFGLGFTIGPGLGALLGHFARQGILPGAEALPFYVAALIGIMNAIWCATILREPPRSVNERADARRERPSLAQLRALLQDQRLRAMLVLNFVYTVSVSIMESTFFVFSEARYGWDERQVGTAMAGLGLLMAFLQGGVGRVSLRVGDRRMVAIGLVLVGGGLLFAPFFMVIPAFLIFLAIATAGRAFAHPGILAMTSSTKPASGDAGRVMGSLQSAASLGRIIGPAAGGAAFQYAHPDSPFWFAGAIMLLAVAWWWRNTRQ